MLNNVINAVKSFTHFSNTFLKSGVVLKQQLRTTYILKRKYTAPLHKKEEERKRLRPKYYIYETIQNVALEKKPNLDLILLEYVEGIGNPGDNVSVSRNYGYNNLLLPGIAVYATLENLEKYKDYKSTTNELKHSSPNAHLTANQLSQMVLSVVMNGDNPWTLQKWHIRNSFRKCGYIVPEEAIMMPKNLIKGPDVNLQDKEFYVTVTINNFETVNVRCRIHHWSTEITERMPHVYEFWKETPGAIFPEDESVLSAIPKKGYIEEAKALNVIFKTYNFNKRISIVICLCFLINLEYLIASEDENMYRIILQNETNLKKLLQPKKCFLNLLNKFVIKRKSFVSL